MGDDRLVTLADPARAPSVSFVDAIHQAISEAMERDPRVVVMGVSADDPLPTRGSTGLVERFGKARVIGTPLSEDGMTGVAIGMALAGMRPVQVHGRLDFTMLGMNQLVNVAAKIRGMFAGRIGGVPLVVRATIGRSWGQGAQHSQGLQSFFAHVPGLRVVMPSTPADAKGAMEWSLSPENRDPVIFIDHRMLHKTTGELVGRLGSCRPGEYRVYGSRIAGSPPNDITVVAISYMRVEAERAVSLLERFGIRCTLFDPLWIRPIEPCLDGMASGLTHGIISDVERTKRLLVIDCGWSSFGVSAEIVARVAERAPLEKVARMGFAETVCPTAKSLEALYYPTAETIAGKAYEMVRGAPMPGSTTAAPAPERAEFRGPF